MNTPPLSTLDNTMRDLSLAVRLLFSRRHATLARMLALQSVRTSSVLLGASDAVRRWEAPMQTDRGLGRARCLQRLTRVDEWPVDDGAVQAPGHAQEPDAQDTAAYLFAAAMNLSQRMPLAAEVHVLRLWFLAAHAESPPAEALRLFGDLRGLPVHQQLAVGARTVDRMDQRLEPRASGPARAQAVLPDAVSPFGPPFAAQALQRAPAAHPLR